MSVDWGEVRPHPRGHVLARRGEVSRWDHPAPFGGVAGPRGLALAALRPWTAVACVHTSRRTLALTFDDGPDEQHTPEVLDALARHGVRATFFVLADRAVAAPHLVHRMVRDGHEVGLHGADHRLLPGQPTRVVASQLREARRAVADVCGRPVHLYRPAYGALTASQTVAARALGLAVVLWSAWGRDWQDDQADVVAARTLRTCHPGAFVLLHDADGDGAAVTYSRAAMVDAVLDGLRTRGYSLRPVGELLEQLPQVRTFWPSRHARTGGAA
jgi:peptidoglycan/xylan/chitin deacetylase (PgdA/CDA1 family)